VINIRNCSPAVADLLSRPECEPALRRGLKSTDRFIRRAYLRLAVTSAGMSADFALRDALGDADSMLRFWAVKQLLANHDPETLLRTDRHEEKHRHNEEDVRINHQYPRR
jgi:hypothetical protein